jgi:hypothetical protein
MTMTQAAVLETFAAPTVAAPSKARLWAGRVLSGIGVLFMLVDSAFKFTTHAAVQEAMAKLGWSMKLGPYLGAIALACTLLYVVRRTSVIGAVLMTGYLGGAVATHVRVGGPAFSIVFPFIIAAFFWGGLLLRNERVRAVMMGE